MTRRPYNGPWPKLRRAILERYSLVCQLRHPGCTGTATTVDHIVALSRGGSDHPDNLVAAWPSVQLRQQGRRRPPIHDPDLVTGRAGSPTSPVGDEPLQVFPNSHPRPQNRHSERVTAGCGVF